MYRGNRKLSCRSLRVVIYYMPNGLRVYRKWWYSSKKENSRSFSTWLVDALSIFVLPVWRYEPGRFIAWRTPEQIYTMISGPVFYSVAYSASFRPRVLEFCSTLCGTFDNEQCSPTKVHRTNDKQTTYHFEQNWTARDRFHGNCRPSRSR